MSPEERKARSAGLHTALEAYLDGQGFTGMLGDWLVLGSVVRVDDQGDADCEYFVGMSGGSMLQHHALGLLTKAEHVLTQGSEGGGEDE